MSRKGFVNPTFELVPQEHKDMAAVANSLGALRYAKPTVRPMGAAHSWQTIYPKPREMKGKKCQFSV